MKRPAGEACFGGACDTVGRFEVTFRLEDELLVGALGLEIDYAGVSGAFAQDANGERCKLSPGINALVAFNDVTSRHTLIVSIASGGTPFLGPADVFTCQFQSDGIAPVAEDFEIQVTDASDRKLEQIVPRPTIVASEIHEILP